MSHCKVDVEHSHQLGVSLNDFPNAFTSESLFPESSLDLVQDLLVTGLGLVKHYRSARDSAMINRNHRS